MPRVFRTAACLRQGRRASPVGPGRVRPILLALWLLPAVGDVGAGLSATDCDPTTMHVASLAAYHVDVDRDRPYRGSSHVDAGMHAFYLELEVHDGCSAPVLGVDGILLYSWPGYVFYPHFTTDPLGRDVATFTWSADATYCLQIQDAYVQQFYGRPTLEKSGYRYEASDNVQDRACMTAEGIRPSTSRDPSADDLPDPTKEPLTQLVHVADLITRCFQDGGPVRRVWFLGHLEDSAGDDVQGATVILTVETPEASVVVQAQSAGDGSFSSYGPPCTAIGDYRTRVESVGPFPRYIYDSSQNAVEEFSFALSGRLRLYAVTLFCIGGGAWGDPSLYSSFRIYDDQPAELPWQHATLVVRYQTPAGEHVASVPAGSQTGMYLKGPSCYAPGTYSVTVEEIGYFDWWWDAVASPARSASTSITDGVVNTLWMICPTGPARQLQGGATVLQEQGRFRIPGARVDLRYTTPQGVFEETRSSDPQGQFSLAALPCSTPGTYTVEIVNLVPPNPWVDRGGERVRTVLVS